MRKVPEVKAGRGRAVVARGEAAGAGGRAVAAKCKAAGVDGSAFDVVVARGEDVAEGDLTSVVGRGGPLGPAAVLEEVEAEDVEEDEDDILHGARAGAEWAVMARVRKGQGLEGIVVRAQVREGSDGAQVSTGTCIEHKASKVR